MHQENLPVAFLKKVKGQKSSIHQRFMVHLRNLCSKAVVNIRSLINMAKHCLLLALMKALSTQHNAEMGALTILRYSKFMLLYLDDEL